MVQTPDQIEALRQLDRIRQLAREHPPPVKSGHPTVLAVELRRVLDELREALGFESVEYEVMSDVGYWMIAFGDVVDDEIPDHDPMLALAVAFETVLDAWARQRAAGRR